MQMKYLVILLSILSVAILYGISLQTQTPYVTLDNLSKYNQQTVTTNATVINNYISSYGQQTITLRYINNSNVTEAFVIIEEPIETQYGDIIQVTGTVQEYKGDWEILVDNPNTVTLLKEWNKTYLPLSQLASHPTHYMGININTSGTIDRIYDHYFYLIDETGEHTIVCYADYEHSSYLYEGATVELLGFFTYHEQTLRYIIDIDQPYHFIQEI